MSDKLSLIASMAATLEAGDRAAGLSYRIVPATEYVQRAIEIYAATLYAYTPRNTVDDEREEAA